MTLNGVTRYKTMSLFTRKITVAEAYRTDRRVALGGLPVESITPRPQHFGPRECDVRILKDHYVVRIKVADFHHPVMKVMLASDKLEVAR